MDTPAVLTAQTSATIAVRALLPGDRIDTRGLEHRQPIGLAPLALPLASGGAAVLFRFGAVVFFNGSLNEQESFIAELAPLIEEPGTRRKPIVSASRFRPGVDEQVEPSGTLILKGDEHGTLSVDCRLASSKSLVLSLYETRLAHVFDRIEPLAATLRARGRPGARMRSAAAYR